MTGETENKQTYGQTDKGSDRYIQTERKRDKNTYIQTEKHTHRYDAIRQTDRQYYFLFGSYCRLFMIC